MNRQNSTLKDKRIVVLGGSSGLGLATAKAASQEGAQVVIASSNRRRIDNALKELPGEAEGKVIDLTKEENIKTFFEQTGNFDHLVYTAGENITAANVQEADITAAKDFFSIRFWGVFTAVKYGSSHINPGGSISLMSGNFGQRPAKSFSLGASVCGAMDAFTRAMAVELAPLRVNNVAAGVIKTALWNNMNEDDLNNFFNYIENSVLLKRVGDAEDVALAFLYLMKQTYMTGQSLIVDGGAVLV